MSTPTWLHDAQALPTTENGAFAPPADPSITFIQTPPTAGFDYNQLQLQQQHLQNRLQNGTARNGSPALNNPVYPTQPLIPSKRARPREDSIGASPRPNPGALPTSRSQTPQQVPFPGFQGTVNGGQPFQAPASYQQQYQQPSSTASLSPVVQNQHFTPQMGPQRVQTTSPSPFSPGAQNFGTQVSPPHSDHGSRVSTPQNGGQMYGPNLSHSAGPSQSFSPPLGSNLAGPSMSPYGQSLEPAQQRQKMHEMRLRHLQASGSPAPLRNHGEALNSTVNPSVHMPTYQLGLARPQQAQRMGRLSTSEQFVRGVAQYMQQQGLPFNPHLAVVGRPVNLFNIFSLVMRLGGSRRLTQEARWPQTAEFLAIPQDHWLSAAHEIQSYWAANLSTYEVWWLRSQHLKNTTENARRSQNMAVGEISNAHGQYSPSRQAGPQLHEQQKQQFVQGQMQPQPKFQTPVRHVTPQQHEVFQPNQNGYLTPQHVQVRHRQPNLYGPSQPGVNAQHHMQTPQQQAPAVPVETNSAKKKSSAAARDGPALRPSSATDLYRETELPEIFRPQVQVLSSNPEETQTYGGYEVDASKDLIDRLLYLKPNVPAVEELGVVDIRALTMSLRSGIHAEVRYALDTLSLLSNHGKQPLIRECEDLLEVLIECAEDQVELLAENAAEVSDAMLISSYEEIARGCRVEVESLQDVHQFGSLDYELDRAVDRLICITTILRNFSFPPNNPRQLGEPSNQRLLASSVVVQFFAGVIRYLGTRNMLLRTHRNTLDFSNDVVVYFSNVSQDIDLPGREEAFCILHFLLSFAPSPPPTSPGDEDFHFTPYSPWIHPYYAPAVDSLAKLLARDDPNRTFYRAIFLADAAAIPPYDLLTRSYGLAVATVPEFGKEGDSGNEDRRAVLAQGLLAAEILIGLIPSSDHVLARSWLSSQDGFALSLAKLVFTYSQRIAQLPPRYPDNPRTAELVDPRGERMIASRGLAVLRRLSERAKDSDHGSNELPVGIMPQRQDHLRFLLRAEMDVGILQQLCNYSDLGT